MELLDKQKKFSVMVGNLIMYATALGYGVTLGDAYRSSAVKYGHPKSTHRSRLGIDLNLFKGSEYLKKTDDYTELGLFWEAMGGTWGGYFGDGNHFSIAHQAVK